MTLDEFLRVYPLRTQNLMWFLGSGASAAAGIPTASDLIWEFKRELYCSATGISKRSCADLASAALRERLDAHFAALGGFPPAGTAEEYPTFFEAAYPDPSDRRLFLERFLTGAKPSFGHSVLAALMKAGQARILWTTNFDRLIEDSAAGVGLSLSELTVAVIDNASTALEGLNEGRWPLIGKLHGDFQSRRLKNTSDELSIQDAALRRAFVEAARRFGLIVIGYSGRDGSIIDALEEGLANGQGYPSGLFWFERPGHSVLPRVAELLAKAEAAGVNSYLLHAQTFDELLGDIVKQITDLPPDILQKFDEQRRRLIDIPIEQPGTGWPVIRTNALPIQTWPTLCRFVECGVPSFKALREAFPPESRTVVTLTSKGVLAFGSDAELREGLRSYGNVKFDSRTIDHTQLHTESFQLGLLRDAFGMALEQNAPVVVHRTATEELSSFIVVLTLIMIESKPSGPAPVKSVGRFPELI